MCAQEMVNGFGNIFDYLHKRNARFSYWQVHSLIYIYIYIYIYITFIYIHLYIYEERERERERECV
jgi:hypothetical protein